MKDSLSLFFRKIPKHIWILALIVLIGILFRTYHFSDWLQFKGDAFRDATMVSNAFRVGPEALPLLGPRAGGTMLRLGPIFYYFQYSSAELFGSMDAPVLAYPDLFFSILAIPVFYLLSRRYFGVRWSLIVAGMLATSFLAIEYGRFAWNPNATIFFVLTFSLATLKVYDGALSSPSRQRFFAFLSGLTLGIATQLHFSSFLGLPIVLFLFLLWHWRGMRKILSRSVVACFLVGVLLLYTPVLMSEYFKQGENSEQFLAAISSKPSVHGVVENIVQVGQAFANQSARILFGMVDPGQKLVWLAGIFLALGFLANAYLIRPEHNESRRHFLQWTLLLMMVYFILYTPLAFTVDRPRFFLPFMMLPYLYCGYIILALEKRFGRRRLINTVALLGVSIVILGNTHATLGWFGELRQSEEMSEATSFTGRNSKGASFWLVWTHLERSAEMMTASCEGNKPIFFIPSKRIMEYGHSIEYALLLRNPDRPIILERKHDPIARDGCYFFVSVLKDETIPGHISEKEMDAPVNLGGIWVMRFYPTQVVGTYEKKDEKEMIFVPEKRTRNSRVYIGDVINLMRGE